jgi:hypothetical protein
MHITNVRAPGVVLLMALWLALAPGALADWQPGPNAILDNSYSGVIDSPVSGSTVSSTQPVVISGWVVDRSADGWAGIDGVDVYEGDAGQGGTFLGHASSAQSRPDVAQALDTPFWSDSGFGLNLAAGTLGVGGHTLTVYAHTPEKGWWSTQVAFTISAPAAPAAPLAAPVNVILDPNGKSLPRGQDRLTVKGYALDPAATVDQGVGIDKVEVYVDEQRGQNSTKQYIGLADLGHNQADPANTYGPHFYGSGYQIDVKLNNLDPGNHHIYVYAHSSISGQETLASAGFNILGPQ